MAQTTINPMITTYTCSNVEETVKVGNASYVVKVNTTEVPYFEQKNIYFPIDLILTNLVTNATNDEVQNDFIENDNSFIGVANATAVISSNMMNTIMWLVDDSKVLSLVVTQKDLGPDPPLDLTTKGLSILLPGLSKWGDKGKIL